MNRPHLESEKFSNIFKIEGSDSEQKDKCMYEEYEEEENIEEEYETEDEQMVERYHSQNKNIKDDTQMKNIYYKANKNGTKYIISMKRHLDDDFTQEQENYEINEEDLVYQQENPEEYIEEDELVKPKKRYHSSSDRYCREVRQQQPQVEEDEEVIKTVFLKSNDQKALSINELRRLKNLYNNKLNLISKSSANGNLENTDYSEIEIVDNYQQYENNANKKLSNNFNTKQCKMQINPEIISANTKYKTFQKPNFKEHLVNIPSTIKDKCNEVNEEFNKNKIRNSKNADTKCHHECNQTLSACLAKVKSSEVQMHSIPSNPGKISKPLHNETATKEANIEIDELVRSIDAIGNSNAKKKQQLKKGKKDKSSNTANQGAKTNPHQTKSNKKLKNGVQAEDMLQQESKDPLNNTFKKTISQSKAKCVEEDDEEDLRVINNFKKAIDTASIHKCIAWKVTPNISPVWVKHLK